MCLEQSLQCLDKNKDTTITDMIMGRWKFKQIFKRLCLFSDSFFLSSFFLVGGRVHECPLNKLKCWQVQAKPSFVPSSDSIRLVNLAVDTKSKPRGIYWRTLPSCCKFKQWLGFHLPAFYAHFWSNAWDKGDGNANIGGTNVIHKHVLTFAWDGFWLTWNKSKCADWMMETLAV